MWKLQNVIKNIDYLQDKTINRHQIDKQTKRQQQTIERHTDTQAQAHTCTHTNTDTHTYTNKLIH